jgi:serine/threonine protein phosphatase PrpC
MLTLVETISLAGDRNKQNDDAHGAVSNYAWVIDGSTDLHDNPVSEAASDASWLASQLSAYLHEGLVGEIHGQNEEYMRGELRHASENARFDYDQIFMGRMDERWMMPTASVLIVWEAEDQQLAGLDLGDCRCFALGSDDVAANAGSRESATGDEQNRAQAASERVGASALLRDPKTMVMLRAVRATHNLPENGYWVFGLQPECADHARVWTLPLKRPAHVLLCTDGFSALVDRYKVYDAGSLVKAALDKGLQELGRELRAIETADAGGAAHPRFKKSDDATAVLLRLT